MTLKAAFIFVAPECDPTQHRNIIHTPHVVLTTVGVRNYVEACQLALELVEAGNVALELCGGFGAAGVAAVTQAVGHRAAIGVVRFDRHPGLNYRSGDELFQ